MDHFNNKFVYYESHDFTFVQIQSIPGMDQAIAFLAQEGCAQFIDWNPLTATPISLPENAVFVIANSLSEANKAATNDFNQRVVECRVGCRFDFNRAN